MKNFKRILALVLAVMMVATSLMVVTSAADEKVDYNDEAIVRLNKLDIFQGKTDGLEPEDNVTRAEMAQLVGRVMTGDVDSKYWENYTNDTTFEDLGAAAWAVGAITYAYENGIVKGKSDVRFDPMGNVTYQDALTMVVRSLGYTGVSYPNGMINKAMMLGLTNGISGLKYEDAANRGVVATILYNALYAEDSLFAENFNLKSGNYMLVATPSVKINSSLTLPGAEINGYVGKKLNEGYVAFAEIGEDYRAINNNYVYAKTSQISDDIDGDFADKLGYAYELTFENDVLTWGDQCTTVVFENYGDKIEIDAAYVEYNHLYNGNTIVKDQDWFLTFGGEKYNLVDKYDADYTAPTGTHNIILYSDFGAPTPIDHYDYLFNANGDIIDINDNIVLAYKDGAYYIVDANGNLGRKATSDEIKDAISELSAQVSPNFGYNADSDYAMIEQGDVLGVSSYLGLDKPIVGELTEAEFKTANRDVVLSVARNYFCEIVAMDYDNDGVFDAAIYTPYYFGYTNQASNGIISLGGAVDENGNQLLKDIKMADYKVTGAASKLGNYAFYLYTFNRHTNTIDVKEEAKQFNQKGDIDWAVKGKVGTSGIYEDSQVSIDGTVYDIGGWAIDNLLGLYTIRSFDSAWWRKVEFLPALLDKDGNGVVDADEKPEYTDWDGNTVTGYNGWYYNGWNDVLEVGMTKQYTGFKGVVLAGHLIHGVPTKDTSTTSYNFVTFNPYQSTFAIENDQIVVDAIVDATGKYKQIKINSIEGEEFTDIEFHAFCEYIDAFYGDNAGNKKYSYFFDAERKAAHQATPLYKAIEREYIIDELVANTDDGETWNPATTNVVKSNVYSVLGNNADGSYQLSILTKASLGTAALDVNVKFELGVSNTAFVDKGKAIAVDNDTIWTFVTKDGIYTYTGVPAANETLNLDTTTKVYKATSDNIMLFDLDRCIEDICVGPITWSEKVQDVAIVYANTDKCDVAFTDTAACDVFYRRHVDTWALNEYVPTTTTKFMAEEIYMVTEKTANTKIYNDNGVMLYVYSNLYNLVDNKYEETVTFSGEEAKVFLNNGADSVWYEDGTGKVTTNYGAIIARSSVTGVSVFTVADLKDTANTDKAASLFNLEAMTMAVYGGQDKDNNGSLAHLTLNIYDAENDTWAKDELVTVKSLKLITVYGSGKNVAVGDASKIAKGAVIFYTRDAKTGAVEGYAFN